MKRWLVCLVLAVAACPLLRADTIYQTNPQGKRVVIHRDAIVVKEDSYALIYKHFELKERRVVKVTLSQGSVPFTVATSTADERKEIVNKWKRFGYTATALDTAGKSVHLYAVYLDFYPPGGRGSLLESIPPRTTFPILTEAAGADELDFAKIDRIEFAGEQLKITLRSGETVAARLRPLTNQPVEPRLLGITDAYEPASPEVFDYFVPLDRLKEIRFDR